MARKTLIRGTVEGLLIQVELHHEASGLVTVEELSIDAPVRGRYTYCPGSYFEPPESDCEVRIDLSDEELDRSVAAACEESSLGLCTVLSPKSDLLSQLLEIAQEAVSDDVDRYLDYGDQD
jgi:hypothetical protein